MPVQVAHREAFQQARSGDCKQAPLQKAELAIVEGLPQRMTDLGDSSHLLPWCLAPHGARRSRHGSHALLTALADSKGHAYIVRVAAVTDSAHDIWQ